MQWLRSLVFNAGVYLGMFVIAVVFFPLALFSRDWALTACKAFCRWTIWSARWMVGLRVEIRGTPPTGPALIAAKHQSFFDIIAIFANVPMGRFIMKRELLWAPMLGQYARRIGCVPVNRGRGAAAVAQMVREVTAGMRRPGQLIIYPQGTRVAPGVVLPYKIGAAVLYAELGQDCYPVATNIGLFWPKRGVLRRPGTAVVEFLPPIPAGLPRDEFLSRLRREIETRSDALLAEAGFHLPPPTPAAEQRNGRPD